MKNDTQARIEHEIAELRGAYPRIISGPACESVEQALQAGFEKARAHLRGIRP